MKNKILLGSTLLASALMLNVPSAMAEPIMVLPYTSSAHADAQGENNNDGPNPGPSKAGASGLMTSSYASVRGYELHSYSEAFNDIYLMPKAKPPVQVPDTQTDVAVARGIGMEYPIGVYTSGRSSFTQQFQVVGAGNATLRFDWDGSLFSDGTYTAGYGFRADASSGMGRLGSVGTRQEIGGGSANVNLFDTIDLFFGSEDIGKTFEVFAELSTYVNDRRELEVLTVPENGIFDALADSASDYKEPMPSAYADFSRTAVFSFNGQGVIAPAAVPLPAAVWLFGSALIGLFGAKRRKPAA